MLKELSAVENVGGDSHVAMDETKELTLQKLHESLEKVRQKEAQHQKLEQIASDMLAEGFDPEAVGSIGLEGILTLLDFERGFLLASRWETPLAGEASEGAEPPRLKVIASCARAAGSGGKRWASVLNPEFAVSRSLVRRALGSGKLIQLNDCLLEPAPQGEAQHRAVLCEPFSLSPGVRGVLYLDRGLGGGDVSEMGLRFVHGFSRSCLPIVARAWVVRELNLLQQERESAVPAEPPAEKEGDREAEPILSTAEAPVHFGMVGRDDKLKKLFQVVEKVKDADLNICIVGESGTGKELLARAIHQASQRKDKLFVAENCGSIAENLLESELFGHVKGSFTGADEDHKGLFELANSGTLFLDEIGDMSEGMQRKLLRVLEEGMVRPIGGKQAVKVDVRVLCASNRDLKQLVRKKSFRADLYYRLNVITLDLPPLRERADDIPLLVVHFAAEVAREEGITKRFSESAMNAFLEYSWPGNVRELRNLVRRVMLTSTARVIARKDVIGLLSPTGTAPYTGEGMERDETQLLLRIPPRRSFHAIIEECERVVLLNALKECAWNKSKVTQVLKIPRQSLYNKIARYKLERQWEARQE